MNRKTTILIVVLVASPLAWAYLVHDHSKVENCEDRENFREGAAAARGSMARLAHSMGAEVSKAELDRRPEVYVRKDCSSVAQRIARIPSRLASVFPSRNASDTQQSSIQVAGKVTVHHADSCSQRVYPDVREGMSIIARDARGEIVGVGRLSTGLSGMQRCIYTFSFSVPAGSAFYEVEYGRRGTHGYSAEDIQVPIDLQLRDSSALFN